MTARHGAPGAGVNRPTHGDGPYFVDVDPDGLTAAAHLLADLGDHLAQRGTQVTNTPAEIPTTAWAGAARTAICAEMTALGGQVGRFAGHFDTAGTTLAALATACREAQAHLAHLNLTWQTTQDTYAADLTTLQARQDRQTTAISPSADPSMDPTARKLTLHDLTDSYAQARSEAGHTRDTTLRRLDGDYQDLVDGLRAKFRQTSQTLAAATMVAVPDSTVSGFITGDGTGMMPSWIAKDGSDFPPDLHAETALGGTRLLTDHRQLLAGQGAADRFNQFFADGKTHSRAEIEAFLAGLHPDSAAFRQGFLAHLDPKTLLFTQQTGHFVGDEGTSREYGKVITTIGRMMAAGSNTGLQGAYPVPVSFYQHWADVYEHTTPPATGYLMMAELVQAGQGSQATWDTDLLVTLTRQTVSFEQQQVKANPNFVWIDPGGLGFMPTDAGRNLTTNSAQVDPVAMMLDATSKDEHAALKLFTNASTHPGTPATTDTTLLHYLYEERAPLTGVYAVSGGPIKYGTVLGNTLEAATTAVGSGGKGTPEYISAAIVSDVVNYYGTPGHRLWPGMERPIVGMLCHHIQDVNASTDGPVTWTGVVHEPMSDGLLAREWLTVAVMDRQHVQNVLTEAFAADYTGAGGPHPLFQEFTAVQTAALRQDFLTAATIKDTTLRQGRMLQIATEHGEATTFVSNCLRDALVSQGVKGDAANAQARAAASWMIGMASGGEVGKMTTAISGAVPGLGGRAGVFFAGAAVETVQNWAVDQLVPQTHHAADMTVESGAQESRLAVTNSLVYLSWLDQTGDLGAAAPDAWAAQHPDRTGFLTKGADGHWHFADLGAMYNQSVADHQTPNTAWNDFTDYWRHSGNPQLRSNRIFDAYQLGRVMN